MRAPELRLLELPVLDVEELARRERDVVVFDALEDVDRVEVDVGGDLRGA